MARRPAAEVAAGDVIPVRTVTLTRADLVRYAGASGDFNPIHWSDSTASAVGLPDVLAHGMLTMGRAIGAVTDWAGDPGAVVDYTAKFTRPVVVPDQSESVLEIGGTVTEVLDDGRVKITLTVMFDGQTVLGKCLAVVQLA